MIRKHLNMLAEELRDLWKRKPKTVNNDILDALCKCLKRINPNFDKDKFIKAVFNDEA